MSWKEEPFYDDRVEELDIKFVEQFIGNDLRKSSEEMDELEIDIKKNGFTHPVTLIVGRFDKKVRLGEGNHRLEIAKRLGMNSIPVMIGFYKKGNGLNGYDTITYPYLSSSIENIDIEYLMPSKVFVKMKVLYKRIAREKMELIDDNCKNLND